MAANIIAQLEQEESARLLAARAIPEFRPGDTLRVNVKIKEGERERVQAYEGVCIARAGTGVHESFTVRKISFGEGVERLFPLLSPSIESIEVKRRGVVRRAKLYYLRDRRGKSARIAERAGGPKAAATTRRVIFVDIAKDRGPGGNAGAFFFGAATFGVTGVQSGAGIRGAGWACAGRTTTPEAPRTNRKSFPYGPEGRCPSSPSSFVLNTREIHRSANG